MGFGYAPIPNGIVSQGKIQSRQKLAEILARVCKGAVPSPVSSTSAILSFADLLTYSYLFPGVALPVKKEAIFKKASTLFPIDPKNLTCDWTLTPSVQKGVASAWVVATEFSHVKDYKEALSGAEVSLEIIEPEAESLARLFAPKSVEPSLIVDFGARKTQAIVVQSKRVMFTKSLKMGGDHVTHALSEALSLTPKEAEIIKRQTGLKPNTRYKSAQGVVTGLIQQYLYAHISQVVTEMTQRGLLAPKQIILVGGSSLLPGLKEYLTSTMSGVHIVRLEPWSKIGVDYRTLVKKVRGFQPMTYSVAIGLALRGVMDKSYENGVNLIEHFAAHGDMFPLSEAAKEGDKKSAGQGGLKKKKKFWTLKLH